MEAKEVFKRMKEIKELTDKKQKEHDTMYTLFLEGAKFEIVSRGNFSNPKVIGLSVTIDDQSLIAPIVMQTIDNLSKEIANLTQEFDNIIQPANPIPAPLNTPTT